MEIVTLPDVLIFEWDEGNSTKNWTKHAVTDDEAQEPFFDERKYIFKDIKHSAHEHRYGLFGKTKKGKLLFIAFTIRQSKIRVISARSINRREAQIYEKAAQATKV